MQKHHCDKCFKEIEQNSDHQDWCPYRHDTASIEDIFGDIFKQPKEK